MEADVLAALVDALGGPDAAAASAASQGDDGSEEALYSPTSPASAPGDLRAAVVDAAL